MNKNYTLVKEIINKYHPSFKNDPAYQKFALEFHDILNVERLIEYTLASVGGYNFVDEGGRDFDCPSNSDSKTVTVVNNGGITQSRVMIIGSVENKIGSLRVTIYNPFKDGLDFMYIPKDDVQYLMENDGTKGTANYSKKRIRANWSWARDSYNKLEPYRLSSFEELASASDYVQEPSVDLWDRIKDMPALYTFSQEVSEKIMNKQYPINLSKEESKELFEALER